MSSVADQPPASLPNAGLTPVGAPSVAPGSTVLTVGAGEQFATLGAALASAHDGATILVDAGTYVNDFGTVAAKVTIEGVGGMANFVATVPPPNLKGILTVDNDVTIENLSFSGSAIPDADGGNGAGIRYEGGQMVLENDSFSGNQDGLLAFPVLPISVNTITIDHSVFKANGSGSGYTHNSYVGAVTSLVATNSVFEGAVVGHEFKSRALANTIVGNVFEDGPTGTASYDIDLPNGGVDVVRGNIIEKGPDSENNAMVHFGGEGIPYAGSSLTVTGNTFIDDLGGQAVAVLNQTSISAKLAGNAFTGAAAPGIIQGPGTATANTDGSGGALPDVTLTGVLPGNTTVFTDSSPHAVTLSQSGQAVEGGAGRLTVTDPAGHIIAEGGSGGMSLTEGVGAGGSTITTAAGSTNTVSLVGQDLIDSEGTDTLTIGGGNVTGVLGGTAAVLDGTGNDQWTVNGRAAITGQGGNPVISVAAGASLTLGGPLGYTEVQDNGGSVSLDIVQGGAPERADVTGAADVKVYSGAMMVTTAGGPQGATISLGVGAAQVTSAGADTIHAGSGANTVIVSGAATIYAGTGTLSVYGRGDIMGATVYGNGGTVLLDGDTGNITYHGGAKANTVQSNLSNDTLIGGAGLMTVLGGSKEAVTGGSGGLIYTATDGGGGNTITTAAGATDTLALAGPDTVASYGNDTITGGSGNQAMAIHGNATVTGSTGNSTLSFYGHDTLVGRGQDYVTVNAGAEVMITAGVLTTVTMTDAWTVLSAGSGAGASKVSVAGGSAVLSAGTGIGTAVTTAAGRATTMTSYRGAVTEALNGADTLYAGSGTDTTVINAANTVVWGGSGTLLVRNQDQAAKDLATVHGGSGAMTYSQGGGALRFIGGSGAATLDGGWGSLSVTGGAGTLSVAGGSGGLQFTAGSGQASVAMTPGGGDVTFGAGATSVQVASYGAAAVFHAVAGQGGGTDTITGFRIGTDRLLLSGVSVASEAASGGSTSLVLSDRTHIQLVGVGDPTWLSPPTAVSVASSVAPGSTLTTGQTAVLTVAASEPVTVAGAPTLLLSDGGTATYDAALSGGATLAFDYTVQAGQTTPDLAVVGVSPNGATVTDAAGQALVVPATLPGADMGVSVNPAPVPAPAPPLPTVLGNGPDTLALFVSEDAFQGDAQFTVSINGTQVGGVLTATASHAAGATQEIDLLGTFNTGLYQAGITFINSAPAAGTGGGRVLHIDGAVLNGMDVAGSALTLDDGNTRRFDFGGNAGRPSDLGQGPNTLALSLSEDAFQGDAQFTVAVDGVQVGGVQTVTALHGAKATQAFNVHGSFAAGAHQASVTFLNDLYAPGAGDRNLYLDSATLDGTAVGGASAALKYDRTQSFSFTVPTSH